MGFIPWGTFIHVCTHVNGHPFNNYWASLVWTTIMYWPCPPRSQCGTNTKLYENHLKLHCVAFRGIQVDPFAKCNIFLIMFVMSVKTPDMKDCVFFLYILFIYRKEKVLFPPASAARTWRKLNFQIWFVQSSQAGWVIEKTQNYILMFINNVLCRTYNRR